MLPLLKISAPYIKLKPSSKPSSPDALKGSEVERKYKSVQIGSGGSGGQSAQEKDLWWDCL